MNPYEQAYQRLDDEHLDAVDAAVFSGDMFYDDDTRAKFRALLERWISALDAIDSSGFGNNP